MSGNETNNQTRAVLIPPAYAHHATDAQGIRAAASAIGARPPGGRSVDLMNYSNDFDIYTGWADAVTGRDFSQVADRAYHAADEPSDRLGQLVHGQACRSFSTAMTGKSNLAGIQGEQGGSSGLKAHGLSSQHRILFH